MSDLPPSYDESRSHELQECCSAKPKEAHNSAAAAAPKKTTVITINRSSGTPFRNLGVVEVHSRERLWRENCMMSLEILSLLTPLLFVTLLIIFYTFVQPVREFINQHQLIIWLPILAFFIIYIFFLFLSRVKLACSFRNTA